jgi:cold shock CspA family protein
MQNERFTGIVKWFDNKKGYGFITDLSSTTAQATDIFVHHSALKNALSFRYLVQGEYVEFGKGKHDVTDRIVAVDVTGIKNGKLMCETRAENQPNRSYPMAGNPSAGDWTDAVPT